MWRFSKPLNFNHFKKHQTLNQLWFIHNQLTVNKFTPSRFEYRKPFDIFLAIFVWWNHPNYILPKHSNFFRPIPGAISKSLRLAALKPVLSPADDFSDGLIDLNKELVKHPYSTFYARANGNSMKDAGIGDGDLAPDKSIEPTDGKSGGLLYTTVSLPLKESGLKKIAVAGCRKPGLSRCCR